MATRKPKELDDSQIARRQQRVARLADHFGFAGIVEYRHAISQSGGAQFCFGATSEQDCLLVYAEAFERDFDPGDFSLSAIIAHECGHQRAAFGNTDGGDPMIGKRKLRDIQKDFAKIMATLPADSPEDWFDREIEDAMNQPGRNVKALQSLKRFLMEAKRKPVRSRAKGKAVGKKTRRLAASQ